MTAVEPYTEEEFYQDCRDWTHASVEQKAAAFDVLIAAAGGVAVNRQNKHLIAIIRGIRDIRSAS